jgi:hypothetical protein
MYWNHRQTKLNAKIGLGLFAIVFLAAMLGVITAQQFKPDPPLVLKADSASAGEKLSMATGLVDRDRFVEGLFVLDHLSGLLQCWLINSRTGAVAGIYTTNVTQHLELPQGGDADYVMTTGSIQVENSAGRRGNVLPAGCICYVGDGNTGKVVGYTLFYDRQLIANNGSQRGELEVVARGLARDAATERDSR